MTPDYQAVLAECSRARVRRSDNGLEPDDARVFVLITKPRIAGPFQRVKIASGLTGTIVSHGRFAARVELPVLDVEKWARGCIAHFEAYEKSGRDLERYTAPRCTSFMLEDLR